MEVGQRVEEITGNRCYRLEETRVPTPSHVPPAQPKVGYEEGGNVNVGHFGAVKNRHFSFCLARLYLE